MVNKIIINNCKKKKIKRLSSNRYYATAFISNPCDQLFGPPLDAPLATCESNLKDRSLNNSVNSSSITNSSINDTNLEDSKTSLNTNSLDCTENVEKENVEAENVVINSEKFEYIPTPKWNKTQTCTLEDLFKKSRYPKPNELKILSQRLNVMDTDVEV